MAGLVLSDANPLIALKRVNGLALLPSLFGTVSMPPEVHSEVLPGQDLRGEDAIMQALSAGWLAVTEPPPGTPALPEPPPSRNWTKANLPASGSRWRMMAPRCC